MRRGGLRRGVPARLAAAAALAVIVVVAGCQSAVGPVAAPPGESTPTTTPSESPAVTAPPVDPLVTVEVCGLALAATETTRTIFNEQLSAFELALARDDEETMAEAVRAIDAQFDSVAEIFPKLAQRPIDPALREVLTDVGKALGEMAKDAYTGTALDRNMKLVDFRLAIESVCAPLTPPAG